MQYLGGRRSGLSRITFSEEDVRVTKAEAGRVWGAVSDQEVYQSISHCGCRNLDQCARAIVAKKCR